MSDVRSEGRRRMFRAAARGLALVGLGGLAWRLTGGRAEGLKRQTCDTRGSCRTCRWLADCGLAQAMSARRVLGNEETDGRDR